MIRVLTMICATLVALQYFTGSVQALDIRDVREFVKQQLKGGKVKVSSPTINDEGPWVSYCFDGPEGAMGSEDKEPHLMLIDEQFRSTAFRGARMPISGKRWQKVLDDADRIIEAMASDVNNKRLSAEEKSRRAKAGAVQISKLYLAVAKEYADARGKELRNPVCGYFQLVELRVEPAGGTISLIDAIEWDFYQLELRKHGAATKEPKWKSIPTGSAVSLAADGSYWFDVTWPNGRNHRKEWMVPRGVTAMIFDPNSCKVVK